MRKYKSGNSLGVVFLIQFIIIAVIGSGWIMNIVKLVKCDFEPSYKAEVIHILGVFPPVGMITGWLNIEDGVIE